MKVLFTVTYFTPYVSGLTLAVQRWADGLSLLGHQVTVLTMRHDPSLPRTVRQGALRIRRVPWLIKISKGFLSLVWWKEAWELSKRHDVVVVHLPQPEAIIVVVAAKLLGKRIVAVYHCEISLPAGFFSQIIQSLMEVSHFGSMVLADSVVTYTTDYATHSRLILLWERFTKKQITAIVPPIPLFAASRRDVASFRKKIGTADIVLGLAARIAAEKGIEYLLAALPRIGRAHKGKRVILAVAGPVPVGEGLYGEKISSLVKQYGNTVIFLGSIPPHMMASFYRCLDILVLPSINGTESFGMVQVEAMLAGVPVIATSLPGVRVPIQKTGMGILIPPKDETAIADAVTALLRNPASYRREQADIRRIFSEEESVRAMATVVTGLP